MPSLFGVPQEIIDGVYSGRRTPAAYTPWLEVLHDKHVIGINNAYQLGSWLDAVFFGDNSWYLVHREKLFDWPGLKICCSSGFVNRPADQMEGLRCLARDKEHRNGISYDPSKVSWNGNSGAAAISVAANLGATQINLLGFDMAMEEKGEYSHWHGSHLPPGKKRKGPPPFNKHLQCFPAIAADAKKRGIKILNVSPISRISAFPKVSLEEALNGSAA